MNSIIPLNLFCAARYDQVRTCRVAEETIAGRSGLYALGLSFETEGPGAHQTPFRQLGPLVRCPAREGIAACLGETASHPKSSGLTTRKRSRTAANR